MAAECQLDVPPWPPGLEAGSTWATSAAEELDSKQRMARLARTLEAEIIPRLVGVHREPRAPEGEWPEVESFVELLRRGTDGEVDAAMQALVRRGGGLGPIFTGMLAPAARRLGEMWEADRCDFSTVTICLGRLQRLLREWSPHFGREVAHPPNGRRVLLGQHPDEQHSFGLSMVAEFFRREGWEVLGGVGGALPDPSARVARDWFDVVGFSIGSESRIDWLRERIVQVRALSRNREVVVLVGGPLQLLNPALVRVVEADGGGHDATQAPRLAEDLVAARHARR
ncbi:MAG: cobalamin B12-binding domain-containing protein [Rubrivivax sp.]